MKTNTLSLVGLLCATGVGCTAHKEMHDYVEQVKHSSEDVAIIPSSTEVDAKALEYFREFGYNDPLLDMTPFCFVDYYQRPFVQDAVKVTHGGSLIAVWRLPILYVKDDKHDPVVLPISSYNNCNTGVPAYDIPAYFLEQPSFIIYDERFARAERDVHGFDTGFSETYYTLDGYISKSPFLLDTEKAPRSLGFWLDNTLQFQDDNVIGIEGYALVSASGEQQLIHLSSLPYDNNEIVSFRVTNDIVCTMTGFYALDRDKNSSAIYTPSPERKAQACEKVGQASKTNR
ncbi:hypothetical protein HZC31_03915 [Candidatus Woesearchaeota archaeon]|nr:hypothetical protein [Candidatus Woesearchaeota archaeon]